MLTLTPVHTSHEEQSAFLFETRRAKGVAEHLSGPAPLSFGAHKLWARDAIDHRSRFCYLIEEDGQWKGYAQAKNFALGRVELGWAIAPQHQNRGVGSEAVWAWSAFARRWNVRDLMLKVKTENERAFHVYEGIGYIQPSIQVNCPEQIMVRQNRVRHARLLYTGHAGFQLEAGETRLLCDPWFNPAFFDSWFPKPGNAHVAPLLARPTHVYLSHAHEDHFDRKYLSTLPRNTRVFCPWWMEERVMHMGFDVRPFRDGDEMFLNGMELKFFCDDRKRDSAVLIVTEGRRILNLNDCHIPVERLPKCDILFSQFSGAFHYPHCYDFPRDVKRRKVGEVRDRYMSELSERARATGAKVYVPLSGPARMVQPAFNRPQETIFYSWELVQDQFDSHGTDVARLQPGDELLIGRHIVKVETPKWMAKKNHMNKLDDDITTYFQKLAHKHRDFLSRHPKSFTLRVGNKSRFVLLAPPGFMKNQDRTSEPNYTITVDQYLMWEIVKGGYWDKALLSNRIRLHRKVDVYDSDLFEMLYRDRDEDEEWRPQSSMLATEMVRRKEGFDHQRWCPHMGQDLSNAPLENGVLTCPRHGWKWDLKTGKCVNGGLCDIIGGPVGG